MFQTEYTEFEFMYSTALLLDVLLPPSLCSNEVKQL